MSIDIQTPAALPPESEPHSDDRQFVTFMVGDEYFAVPMAPVQEIIRVPEVVRVPLGPAHLEGLANLRGRVLPIMSLRSAFGLPPRAGDDATRAVVINLGTPLGFVVDRVSSVMNVEPESIEPVRDLHSAIANELVTGVIKRGQDRPMILVLDFERLIARELTSLRQSSVNSIEHGNTAGELEQEAETDELQLVSFSVAEQEYGVPIDQVIEIVQVPAHITGVPNSARHVIGVMALRERLLPLVSLRSLFGLPAVTLDEHHRIVVLSLSEDGRAMAVGVVMDAVNEVLRVPRSAAEAMPRLLSRQQRLAEIDAICRLDGGRRLVSVLAPDRLFSDSGIHEALDAANQETQQMENLEQDDNHEADDDEQLVVFKLAQEEYAVPIASVQEIVRVPETLTHVPKSPAFVEGVINLRGAVLPVVDQRRRFGLAATERSDRQRIMVFQLAGVRTGFIVDSVAEVLKVPRGLIEQAPQLSSAQSRLIPRVVNLEKRNRLIQLVDPDCLLDDGETQALAEAA
ncbi:chemotaxis protein CheW [Chitinimonas lacunae]|uniref:Chemotaxis protein CheW n=1 Tax=Chitinimonas lacunae TaxID=1963018 RepID=A0ABV8MKT8_9NEIS